MFVIRERLYAHPVDVSLLSYRRLGAKDLTVLCHTYYHLDLDFIRRPVFRNTQNEYKKCKHCFGNCFCFYLQVKIWKGSNQFGTLMSRTLMPGSKKLSFTGHSDLEDDTVTVSQNVRQQTPRDKASRHRRTDTSTAPMPKLKTSEIHLE
jgi:hypothetical protein